MGPNLESKTGTEQWSIQSEPECADEPSAAISIDWRI